MSGRANVNYQGIPQAMTAVLTPGGTMTDLWYRFFQSLWLQISSGVPNTTTLGGVSAAVGQAQADATAAQNTANQAIADVQAEATARAAADTNLQNQIDGITGADFQGQINSLQTQINTINQRLTNAGIP